MPYRFALERENYGDYASGKVFYNLPGHPAFPVRLASEIFQRSLQLRSAKGLDGPVHLYDPCCGGAYQLAVVAYLHRDRIRGISASDIDEQALAIARRNLSLLTVAGLERRIAEIEALLGLYGKASHQEARQSAEALKNRLRVAAGAHPLAPDVFQADALQGQAIREHFGVQRADLVISDIPYGMRSEWRLPKDAQAKEPVWLLLENLRGVLAEAALVVIAADKQHKIAHDGYKQVGKMKAGKRQVVFLESSGEQGVKREKAVQNKPAG